MIKSALGFSKKGFAPKDKRRFSGLAAEKNYIILVTAPKLEK
jgi:hypothetical protein